MADVKIDINEKNELVLCYPRSACTDDQEERRITFSSQMTDEIFEILLRTKTADEMEAALIRNGVESMSASDRYDLAENYLVVRDDFLERNEGLILELALKDFDEDREEISEDYKADFEIIEEV